MSDFNEIKQDTETRMEKTLDTLRGDFGGKKGLSAHVNYYDRCFDYFCSKNALG